jgi:hypothetical protein
MLLVEIFTEYAQFVPLSHPYKVHIVAQPLMDNVIKLHGPTLCVTADREKIFTSTRGNKF